MSLPRIPGAGSTGLPPIHSPGGGSVTPGGGAKTQTGRPDDLSARPVLVRPQSMPPRARLPGGPAARTPSTPAGPAHASPDHVAQEPTPAPAGPRTYEFYMNQLSGLRVDPPPAKGAAEGAGQSEKPAAQSPLPASTGGGAKSDDPSWLSMPLPAGWDTSPPAASGTGAKPEGRPYELPPNPFDTAGTPRPSSPASGGGGKPPEKPATKLPLNTGFTIDSPSPPATPVGVKPEKQRVDTPVTSEPAGKTPGGDAATTGKPTAGSPLPASTGGGAKSDDPFNWLSKPLSAGGNTLPLAASGTGAKPEGRPYELPPNPVDTAGTPRPSSPASGGGGKPSESSLNTFFTVDPPPPPTQPAAPGGGGPDKPEKPQVQASVTIEPGGNQPPSAPVSEADKMQKSQSDYFNQMQQLQMQTNEQQLMTAKLKQDGDMTSALASIIKQGGRGVKDLAA